MKKILIVPDSFKGTLSSPEICRIIKKQALKVFPQAEVITLPVADGGEGSTDSFLQAVGGQKIQIQAKGPYMNDIDTFYGILQNGTAIIETAACAGLSLTKKNKDPRKTTTYGLGQLMLDAAQRGCKNITVGLGGSCTNDAGCGAAAAVGIRFYDADGNAFIPTGGTLQDIAKIDASGYQLGQTCITAMCDITNPLYGQNGAAYVFAPQKGADENCVQQLDMGLRHLADILAQDLHVDVSTLTGGGAAGGMGAGMYAFFHAQLCSGIETVLQTVQFEKHLTGTDLVITGEGRLDSQSVQGKVIDGIAKKARSRRIPVVAIVGGYDSQLEDIYAAGITAVFSINRLPLPLACSAKDSADNLALTAENIFRILKGTSL